MSFPFSELNDGEKKKDIEIQPEFKPWSFEFCPDCLTQGKKKKKKFPMNLPLNSLRGGYTEDLENHKTVKIGGGHLSTCPGQYSTCT